MSLRGHEPEAIACYWKQLCKREIASPLAPLGLAMT
jgi:hypothetical protein